MTPRIAPSWSWLHRHLVTVLFASSLLLVAPPAWVATAPAALAHSQLVSSTPANDATVDTMPAAAELVFNEQINADFSQVIVAGPDGAPRSVTPAVSGAKVTAPLPAGLGQGRIEVRYRIVSKDGHPVDGKIAFTVGKGGPAPSSNDGASPAGASSGSSGATTGTADHSATSNAEPGKGGLVLSIVAVLGGCAALLIWFGVRMVRREQRRDS
ncbi:hypothetical protein KEM60_02766 [Austwickia sp. TVS 96-490-7B]|uniref:copper resistance CopC family protein n=1 Tax=Austwickia sp. TVS 96-490-7B TaxID=2830843 RepID=UPI001C570913|nr:copper resistance CopC family protein [Austwickia sp. TVS 96-490-7B]MBW3086541.1 hypothetical protein [Austwickia sp. TVS 96-490-7B]